MTSFYERFAKKIKSARTRKGVSQKKLAEALSITRQGMAKIENGSHELSFHTMVILAHALDLDLELKEFQDQLRKQVDKQL